MKSLGKKPEGAQLGRIKARVTRFVRRYNKLIGAQENGRTLP